MSVEVEPSLTELHTASQEAGRRFFKIEDGDAYYWFVARDQDHAKEIIRAHGLEFCKPDGYSTNVDDPALQLTWTEITSERAAQLKTHDEDGNTKPLADRKMGDWFCSEW